MAGLPRVLGRSEAQALGFAARMIDSRVASGRWRRVLPRTYLTADVFEPSDRLAAALCFAGRSAALSGAAALARWGVRSVSLPQRVLVLVPPGNRLESYDFVRIRRTFRPTAVATRGGQRLAVPARAAADLALELARLNDVRALVARVVGDGHASLEELAAELEAGPRQGSAHLRRAIADVTAGAASAPEARAAALLRRAGLGSFEQNARIDLPGGGYYIADFLWRDLRAILEIDSVEYHLGPADWRRTMDRHLVLSGLGYSVVHRPPSALADPATFVHAIGTWLDALARPS